MLKRQLHYGEKIFEFYNKEKERLGKSIEASELQVAQITRSNSMNINFNKLQEIPTRNNNQTNLKITTNKSPQNPL